MERVVVAVTSGLLVAVLVTIFVPNPAIAAQCGHNKSHNSFFGEKTFKDVLLYMDKVNMESRIFRTVSATVSTGVLRTPISYIEIIDGYTNGKGGCAILKSGGIGSNSAKIQFTSQRGEGLKFAVKVFGRTR